MNIIDEYFNLKSKVHEYFGYKEDWVTIPLEDYRSYNWCITFDDEDVMYSENVLTEDLIECGEHYQSPIYTQRFLPKWVYRADDYTLICLDTQTDGNKHLAIFDNTKEEKNPVIRGLSW